MKRHPLLFTLGLVSPWIALAHDGHGIAGPHWHATDVWGFVTLAVLIAVVWARRK